MGKTCHYGLFIALITIFSNATLNAAAASVGDTITDGTFNYTVTKTEDNGGANTVSVAQYTSDTSEYSGDMEIPDQVTIDGTTYDVTGIADNAFYNCTNLTGITIPSTVTELGNESFRGCTSLTTIIIPGSVTSIGNYAFTSTGLTSVEIDGDVEIGSYAFSNLTSLTELTLGEDVLKIPYSISEMTYIETLNYNAANAVMYNSSGNVISADGTGLSTSILPHGSLKTVNIGDNVETIPYCLFYNCEYIETVDFGSANSLTTIGAYAFGNHYSYENLTSTITLPESVTTIGDHAFYRCAGITGLTIGANVSSIGKFAFDGCTSLETLTYNATNCNLDIDEEYDIFSECTSLATVNIGSSVESLPAFLFYNCTALETVNINSTQISSMGERIFHNCSSLSSINIEETQLEKIPKTAFRACTSLTSIIIPKCVTTIEDYAFDESGLESVEIDGGIEIGDYAFSNCTSLTKLTLGEDVTTIPKNLSEMGYLEELIYNVKGTPTFNSGAFTGCTSLTKLTIGESVEVIPSGLEDILPHITTLEYDAPNATYSETVSPFPYLYLSDVTIGENVETIPQYLFYNCHNTALTSIEAPSSVETIEEHAFDGCSSLETLILSGATSVDGTAFDRCTSLKTLNLASVTSINPDWFTDCKSTLETLILSSVTSVPDEMFSTEGTKDEVTKKYAFTCNFPSLKIVDISGATSIGLGAFGACTSLEQVTLGSNLTEIKSMAFQECSSMTTIGSNLSSVTLIGDDAFYGCEKLGYINDESSYCELDLSGITDYNNLHPNAFEDCKNITAVKLNDNLTVIQNQTFADCNALAHVYTSSNYSENVIELPTKLTKILYQAFENCYVLAGSLDFESTSVTEIARKAFHNCQSITSVNFPKTINETVTSSSDNTNSIAYQLFQGCTSLTSFTFYGTGESNIESIDHMAFASCTALPSIDIPSTVTKIDYQAFQYCSILNNITLPDVLETIGYNAFDGCTTLSSITIPSSVTTWPEGTVYSPDGNYAFANCTKLESVTLNEGLETIGSYTFYNCTALEEIKLPTSIETLYEGAFKDCTSLATVYELKTLTSATDIPEAEEECFSGVSDYCFLVVPEDYAEYYDSYRSTHATVDYWSGIPYMREKTVKIPITTDEGYVTKYSPYSYVLDSDNDVQCGEITGAAQNGNLTIDWKYSTEGTATIPPCSALLVKATKKDGSYGTEGTFHIPTTNTNDYKDKSITNTTVGNTGMLYGTVNKDYGTINVPGESSDDYYFYKLSYYTNEYGDTSLGFYWCDTDDTGSGVSGEGGAFKLINDNSEENGATYNSGLELAWLAIPKTTIDGTTPSPIKKFYSLDGSDDSDIEEDFNADLEEGTEDTGETVIYNLAGMRVSEMSGKGIYIVNGKKVVKR